MNALSTSYLQPLMNLLKKNLSVLSRFSNSLDCLIFSAKLLINCCTLAGSSLFERSATDSETIRRTDIKLLNLLGVSSFMLIEIGELVIVEEKDGIVIPLLLLFNLPLDPTFSSVDIFFFFGTEKLFAVFQF